MHIICMEYCSIQHNIQMNCIVICISCNSLNGCIYGHDPIWKNIFMESCSMYTTYMKSSLIVFKLYLAIPGLDNCGIECLSNLTS